MTSKTLEKKVAKLSNQVISLQNLVITAMLGFDPEGQYKPSFVKKMLKAHKSPAVYTFTGKESFLKHLMEH